MESRIRDGVAYRERLGRQLSMGVLGCHEAATVCSPAGSHEFVYRFIEFDSVGVMLM